ncbi:MAG: hypothetical protein HPY85_10160 [Anaerolineae bacterium]|jgi:hypothetical protein|nr:hypothetical protein [Anaerolineae bacterium]
MKLHFSVLVALASAAVMLFAIFFPETGLQDVHARMLEWAVILVGIGVLMGIFNLLRNHWQRLGLNFQKPEPQPDKPEIDPRKKSRRPRSGKKVDLYSALVLGGFAVTFLAGMWLTPASLEYQNAVSAVQIPVETSLFALLSVVLLLVGFSFFKQKQSLMGIIFISSVLLFLLLGSGILHSMPDNGWLKDIISILNELPLAGTRGILIGIALGSLLAAVRQILGTSRVYRE